MSNTVSKNANTELSNVFVVEKTGTIKVIPCDKFIEEDLYKKCGFRKSDGFENIAEWGVNGWKVVVYGRTKGKSGQENVYEFPPPIDNTMLYGNVGILCYDKHGKMSGTESTWNMLYEELFGGFDNVDDTSGESEEDKLENVPQEYKTKSGYLKDDFVVESSTSDSDDSGTLMEIDYVFTDDESIESE